LRPAFPYTHPHSKPFVLDMAFMTKPALKPNQLADAIVMREAGYTITAISEALDMSISTVQRHLRAAGATKGSARVALVSQARQRLLERVTSDDTIRDEAAKLIADDLAHSSLIRIRIAVAAEQLIATTLEEAALVMRAAAAYSTVLKNTSDMMRHVMRTDRLTDQDADASLPELRVCEMTDDEIIAQRDAERIATD